MDAQGAEVLGRRLRSTVSAVAACDAAALDAEARRTLLAEVDRAAAALATARGALLLAERESGDWRSSGAPSFAVWRGTRSREGVRSGAAEERRAEALGAMPGLREAAVTGEVTVNHVDVVGRAASRGSEAVRSALTSDDGQQRVLAMARQLDAGRFATAMARLAARIDAASLERGHEAQRAARYLHLTDAADGTRISGRLDRMAGHRLALALEALDPRPSADDERTSEQRRADALTALADKVLSLPDTVPGAAQRPHVSFVMTESSWAALRDAMHDAEERGPAADGPGRGGGGAGGAGRAGAGGLVDVLAGGSEPSRAREPVTLEDGTPVPASEVARVLCDCELTRVVLDSRSEPLDLGRTARTYTGPQRRAVITRDGACFWEGCHLAPRWLEIHHLRWWDRDVGETSVENGVAACSFHHHEVHRRDLAIQRVPLDTDEVGTTSRRVRYVVTARDGTVLAGRPPDGVRETSPPELPVAV